MIAPGFWLFWSRGIVAHHVNCLWTLHVEGGNTTNGRFPLVMNKKYHRMMFAIGGSTRLLERGMFVGLRVDE